MSAFLPSFTPASRTALTGSPSTDVAAFWAITGVVTLAAAAGVVEVIVHMMG
ncbi:MAG: hypothetical protein MOP51_1724 [Citricoccus sp.]|jgi:hypothetical protein|nr:hypothetical protein [Citricoccus sp. WCRC_4]